MFRYRCATFALLVVIWPGLVNSALGQVAIPARRLSVPRSLVPATQQPAATIQSATTQVVDGQTVVVAGTETTTVDPQQQIADQRLAKLRSLSVDRRPSSILDAWANPPQPDSTEPVGTDDEAGDASTTAEAAAEPDPVQVAMEAFDAQLATVSRAVTLGEWEAVRSFMEDELSDEEVTIFYDQLLASLSRTPDSVPSDLPADIQMQLRQFRSIQAQQQRGVPEVNQIDWDVVMKLVELAPAELTEAQLRLVGQLGRAAIAQGHAVKDWVVRLETAGTLTAETPGAVTRRQAAKILFAAFRPVEAGAFLPEASQLRDDLDLEGLNLLTRHLLALYAVDRDRKLLEQAWTTTQDVLAAAADQENDEEKKTALRQAVDLAPQVKKELGQAWLDESFQGDASRGREILASIGGGAAQGLESQATNPASRLKLLELQATAVSSLLNAAPETAEQWSDVLSILATNWLREADVAYQYDTSTSLGPIIQRDSYGNIYYLDSRMNSGMINSNQRISAIATGKLLELRPSDDWIQSIQPSLLPEFQNATAKLYLKVERESEALPYIEQLAEAYPRIAQELVDEFLRVWTRNHDPNSAQNRTSSYLYVYGFQQQAQSIPLTRSKQQRNLEELAELVARLRALPVKLDEQLMQRAFTTCHSSAEVYRLEDIEKVFGQLESIDPQTLASLIQGMRANLGGLWREPATQETAQTKRKKKDIQAEVERGYQVARTVIDEAMTRFPDEWSLVLAKAAILHDENNYQREISPSSQFVDRQQESFAQFQQAAQLYVDHVAVMTEDKYSIEPFEVWFYASLGACDLSQIDTQKTSDPKQPAMIRAAIASMPAPIAEKHLAMFANDLFTRMSAVAPGVKFSYLENGFEIVGDHEQARDAKDVFDYYSDLVTEIKLETLIDGSDVVGHEQPFGVFVNLRHTVEIERESGGFSRYLQNQNTSTTYYYNYGRPLEDYRDKFEGFVRNALDEHFEVLSITFQSEDVNSRATAVEGWRITPYAYLMVKARSPKVDKLPPVRLDLDFMDTSGYAVLPIESPIVPLVASQEPDEPRPVDNISLTQTLDERQADEGKLIIEVQANANGLVPRLEQLVDLSFVGFDVQNVVDQGVSVSRFDPESEENSVISERSWLVTLQAEQTQAKMPSELVFAQPKMEVAEANFQRYEDADLVTVPATVNLEKAYGKKSYAWIAWGAGIPLVAVVAFGVALLVWPRRNRLPTTQGLEMPAQLTPFSVLALLEEIERRGQWAPDSHQQLRTDMHQVERAYFGDTNGDPKPDLASVAKTWVDRFSRS